MPAKTAPFNIETVIRQEVWSVCEERHASRKNESSVRLVFKRPLTSERLEDIKAQFLIIKGDLPFLEFRDNLSNPGVPTELDLVFYRNETLLPGLSYSGIFIERLKHICDLPDYQCALRRPATSLRGWKAEDCSFGRT